MTDEPLDHIERGSLPWRSDRLTECGRPTNDIGGKLLSVEDVKVRINKLGKQRTAFTVCMTCLDRVRYNARWETDPVGVMHRETVRNTWAGRGKTSNADTGRMANELRAIATLIVAHRDEFDQLCTGIADTPNLAERRAQKRLR